MLSVDYSIRDDKNIPPHLTCFTTCGFFRLKEVRQGRVLLVLPRPKYTQSHILFNIYLNIYKYNLIISIHILLIIYLFYTYFIIISKKKREKNFSYFLVVLLQLPIFFLYFIFISSILLELVKYFQLAPQFCPVQIFFHSKEETRRGWGTYNRVSALPTRCYFYMEMLGRIFPLQSPFHSWVCLLAPSAAWTGQAVFTRINCLSGLIHNPPHPPRFTMI